MEDLTEIYGNVTSEQLTTKWTRLPRTLGNMVKNTATRKLYQAQLFGYGTIGKYLIYIFFHGVTNSSIFENV